MTDINNFQINGDHYRTLDPQPWDVCVQWELNFLEGNVIKYLARYKHKGQSLDDLRKARHYLDKLIEIETR